MGVEGGGECPTSWAQGSGPRVCNLFNLQFGVLFLYSGSGSKKIPVPGSVSVPKIILIFRGMKILVFQLKKKKPKTML